MLVLFVRINDKSFESSSIFRENFNSADRGLIVQQLLRWLASRQGVAMTLHGCEWLTEIAGARFGLQGVTLNFGWSKTQLNIY